MSNISTIDGKSLMSELKIPHVVFDEISFKRTGFKNNKSTAKLSFQSSIAKTSDGHYRVSLQANVIKADEYIANVQVTGFCEIDEKCSIKDTLLEQNAVAILFPYIRSELTLITSQPETDPVVLPVININAMLREAKKSAEE